MKYFSAHNDVLSGHAPSTRRKRLATAANLPPAVKCRRVGLLLRRRVEHE
jgi:hypothetical protein